MRLNFTKSNHLLQARAFRARKLSAYPLNSLIMHTHFALLVPQCTEQTGTLYGAPLSGAVALLGSDVSPAAHEYGSYAFI